MDALLDALGKDPAVARRRWLTVAGAALLVAAAALAGRRATLTQDQLCKGSNALLAGAWDEARRAELRRGFEASGAPDALEQLARFEHRLADYTQSWVQMRTEACEATRLRGEQSEEVLSLRMVCLDRRLLSLKDLTEVLRTPDKKAVAEAATAAHALPALSGCADVAALRAKSPPPEKPEVRAEVETVRRDLSRLKAQFDTGQVAAAQQGLTRATERADALGYLPLKAEAHFLLGNSHRNVSQQTSIEHLRRATWLALAAREDELVANAALRLLGLYLNLKLAPDDERLIEWLQIADGAVERIGRPPFEQALYLSTEAGVYRQRLECDKATAHIDEGVALTRKTFPETDPRLPGLLTLFSFTYKVCNAFPRYLELVELSGRLRERSLGPMHPDTGVGLLNLAIALLDSSRFAEALEYDVKAEQTLRATVGVDAAPYAVVAKNRASILFGLGRVEEGLAAAERAKARLLAAFGPTNSRYCNHILDMTLVHLSRRDVAAAGEALAGYRRCRPPPSGKDGIDLDETTLEGLLELERGRPQPALAALRRVTGSSTFEAEIDGGHFIRALAHHGLARALEATSGSKLEIEREAALAAASLEKTKRSSNAYLVTLWAPRFAR